MSDNEIYGVELQLNTKKFKEKMAEIINYIENSTSKIKNGATAVMDIDTSNTIVKIAELERIISNLKLELKDCDIDSEAFKTYTEEIHKAEEELKQLKFEMQDVESENSVMSNTMSKSLKKGISSIKRFSLSLLGVRTAMSLITSSVNTYISDNDELNASLTITKSIIGNALSPAIEKMVDYLQYGVIVIAKVIQLFTGYNALANVTADSLSNASSAAKSLNKNLAGFDEINNLNSSSDLASDISSTATAWAEFQEKIEQVEEIFSKYEDEIKLATTALLVMFGTKTLANISSVIGSATGMTGLLGVTSLLGTIAMGATAVITVVYAYESYQEAKSAQEDYNEQIQSIIDGEETAIKTERKLRKAILEKMATGELDNDALTLQINLLKDRLETGSNTIDNLQEEAESMGFWEKALTNTYSSTREQISSTITRNQEYIDSIYVIAEALGYDDEQLAAVGLSTEDLISTMENQKSDLEKLNSLYSENSTEYGENLEKISDLDKKINTLTRESYQNEIDKLIEKNETLDSSSAEYQENIEKIDELQSKLDALPSDEEIDIKMNADLEDAKSEYHSFFSDLADGLTSWISSAAEYGITNIKLKTTTALSKLKNLFSFDVGTNYVPYDTLAMVHKGEQIVPAKWNPATSGIYNSNEDVTNKIDELIDVINSKDFDVNLDGQKISKSVTSYQNASSRIKGRSVF